MVQRLHPRLFSGQAFLHNSTGLAALMQGIVIDNARLKLQISDIKDFTDNSGGAAQAAIVDVVLPKTALDVSGAGVASLASLNTALSAIHDAHAVLAGGINQARTLLGLPTILVPGGTVATAFTVPAVPKTVGAATGTSAANYASGRTALINAKTNLRRIVGAVSDVTFAVGQPQTLSALSGQFKNDRSLTALNAAAASVGGKGLAKAEVDAALLAIANNIATVVARWNAAMNQGQTPSPLSVIAAPHA